jgi:hypothetical protein
MMTQHEWPDDLAGVFGALQDEVPAPDPTRQMAARRAFLMQAQRLRRQSAVSAVPPVRLTGWNPFWKNGRIRMTLAARLIIALVLLAGSATGTAFAADASHPGQPLYGLDGAMEQVQQRLAFSPGAQARLQVHFATERGEEMIALARAGEPAGSQLMTQLRTRLQTQLETALRQCAQLGEPARTRLLAQLGEMAQTQTRAMQQAGLTDAAALMAHVRTQAQLGIDDPAGLEHQLRAGFGYDGEPGPAGPGGPGVQDGTEDAGQNGDLTRSRTRDCDPAVEPCEPVQDQTRLQQGPGGPGGSDGQNGDQDCDPTVTDCTGAQTQTQAGPGPQPTATAPAGNNTDPSDPDPGNDTPGDGDPGGNDDPGDPDPGNPDTGGSGSGSGSGSGGGSGSGKP